MPLGALPALEPGGPAFLFTHLHVRDDAMVLYGFPTREERDTFEVLHRRDRRRARSSRSRSCRCTRRTRCAACLADDDLDALTLVPGVGKRTAQRLLVELQGAPRASPTSTSPTARRAARRAARRGARRARPASATRPTRCARCSRRLPDDGAVEDLLRDALRSCAVRGRGDEWPTR